MDRSTSGKILPSIEKQGEQAIKDGSDGLALFVSPSKDMAGKPGSDSDSWFAFAYLESSRGMTPFLVHMIHLEHASGLNLIQTMYSMLDPRTNEYLTEQFDTPMVDCKLDFDKLEVITPNGQMTGDADNFKASGNFSRISFDIALTRDGPILPSMGNGVMPFYGGINYHYAVPTMIAEGSITIDGETYQAKGPGWIDRQWGTGPRLFEMGHFWKWAWFGIMLDNGDRLNVWDIFDGEIEHAYCTIVHKDGGVEVVPVTPVVPLSGNPWKSPETGNIYPLKWDLRLPTVNGHFTFEPKVKAQEIVAPNPVYNKYEGTTDIVGTIRGEPVQGKVIIELVGQWK